MRTRFRRLLCLLAVMLLPLLTSGLGASKGRCPRGMVLIPAGSFVRGSMKGRLDEQPPRTITLRAFCLDRTEVGMRAYRRCIRAGRCKAPRGVPATYGNQRPAVGVDWEDARTFCRWANKTLPTEAQWEKAARGRRKGLRYPIRGKLACHKANYGALPSYPCRKGHPQIPTPLRKYAPGPYGLYDMAGNVAEWVQDCYSPTYYRTSKRNNPRNTACGRQQARVIRGGSLSSPPTDLRVSARKAAWAFGTFLDVGFRCASTTKP